MNNNELQAETEAQQSKNAELLPSALLVANPMLAAAVKLENEIISEYYPTINHVELGDLYCRDKVILIMREYSEQFKTHYWSEDAIIRLKAEYFEKGMNSKSGGF